MKRVTEIEQTWFDDAVQGTTPPVWLADRGNYQLLGVTDDGALYPVWRNTSVYLLPRLTSPVWSNNVAADLPVERLRITFHRAEVVSELTVQDRIVPNLGSDERSAIARELFGRLVLPVSKAFHSAVDQAYGQAFGDAWEKWEAQEKKRAELSNSDHWFTIFAPRHARAVMRMRHDGRSTLWTMQLEWATLKPLSD